MTSWRNALSPQGYTILQKRRQRTTKVTENTYMIGIGMYCITQLDNSFSLTKAFR